MFYPLGDVCSAIGFGNWKLRYTPEQENNHILIKWGKTI